MPLTLIDVKNHLFSHFITESTFSVADDLASIKLPEDELTETLTTHKAAIFKTALKELAANGIITEVEGTSGGVYVLMQPITSYPQTVTISPIVAEMVGDLVNEFSDEIDGSNDEGFKYVCNKMNLSNEDIARLCQLCHMLLNGPKG